jgi:hypothetical protein
MKACHEGALADFSCDDGVWQKTEFPTPLKVE